MRYNTAGDYYWKGNRLRFDICKQINDDYEFLILIHELIEEHITRKRGITEQTIMDFDLMYEEERGKGLHSDSDEPGHDLRAPYRREHIFAESIERMLANELGIDWMTYENDIIS